MKTRMLAGVVVLVLAGCTFAADEVPQTSGKLGQPIQLFNGKDLEAWTWVTGEPKGGGEKIAKDKVWYVKNGVLFSNGKNVSAFTPGYLRVDKEFTNYVLTVEQKHVNKGNGGILIGITGPDKVWPKTLQIQGNLGDVGDFVNQGGVKITPDAARTAPKGNDVVTKKLAASSEKPMGEWNVVQIVVDHGKVSVTVNGVLQNEAKDADVAGKIGLQAEGTEMAFRKIEVRPIE